MGSQREMLREIEHEVRLTRQMTGRERFAQRVMTAMAEVPRDRFVPEQAQRFAFENGPLPIGCGQTISQPYIVALMTDLLAVDETASVLEIGTGSGYQAAVLSRLVKQVYSVEIIDELSQRAQGTLRQLGYDNVTCRSGDGYQGWPEHAPYDGVLVTAAAPEIPAPLIEQLKPGARLVIPVGQPHGYQELKLVEKGEAGDVRETSVLGVAFVPLTRRDSASS